MKFISVCSGIESASVAWEKLKWRAIAFAEIENFPSAVLKHHFPRVPNVGDMTKFEDWLAQGVDVADADMLVGGTPCQAFSWAGLRKSLGDVRGNLTLVYIKLLNYIDEKRNAAGRPAAICVWENVPGVLNTKDNAFGCFLGGLAGSDGPLEPPDAERGWQDAGYVVGPRRTIGWRCLDAQYLGLAQRRHRVFVVASAREGFNPAAILFEQEGVRRDSPPRRETGQRIAPTVSARSDGGQSGRDAENPGVLIPEVTGTLSARTKGGGGLGTEFELAGEMIPDVAGALDTQCGGEKMTDQSVRNGHILGTMTARMFNALGPRDVEEGALIPVPRPSEGVDAYNGKITGDVAATLNTKSGDGVSMGPAVLAPVPFDETQITSPDNRSNPQPGDPSHPLTSQGRPPAIAFSAKDHGADATNDLSPTLRVGGKDGGANWTAVAVDTYNQSVNPLAGALRSGAGPEGIPAVCFKPSHYTRGKDGAPNELGWTVTAGADRGDNHPVVHVGMAVRRLTPVECERLQGFPDGWTQIPYRGKPAENCPDGPRYKALGNSMATTVMFWIGNRIDRYLKKVA